MMRTDLHDRLIKALLSRRLVSNAFRGTLVEAIIALAVEPTWRWLDGGWGSYDFDGPDGLRLEIKQSAARQDWHTPNCKASRPSFDIKPRTGFHDVDGLWHDAPGRNADIYCFAWHPVEDAATADHRDPDQWTFFIVPALGLPDQQKTIGIGAIERLAGPVGFDNLLAKLNEVASGVRAA